MHDPIIALTGNAVLSHALLGLGAVSFSVSMGLRAMMRQLPWVGGLPTFAVVCSLAGLGISYSLVDQGDFNVRVQFLATFVLLPLMWAALSSLASQKGARRSLGKLLLFYVATELGVMLLQASYFLIGVGIAPGELYESMIPGSQFNGNNLAAIVVLLSIFYNATSQEASRVERFLFNAIVFAILAITFSRLAMLLFIADRLRSLNVRQFGRVLAALLVLVVGAITVANVEYTGNDTIDASLYKAKSLATIAEIGFEADSSTSGRSASYSNFFQQIGGLGIGSAAILNYDAYTASADFADAALYVNPHSLVIEFGYWMGWPGLLALGAFMLVGYARSDQGSIAQRGFLLLAVLLTSSIPSSAIALPPLWAGLLLLAMLSSFVPAVRSPPLVSTHAPRSLQVQ
jgi:hypothetical protein